MADDAHAHGPVARFRLDAGERPVVHVAGELDAESGTELGTILDEALSSDATAIVIDLAELDFIDSVGLSVLVSAHQRGQAAGIGLEIHAVPPACRRVFEITRLDEVLDLR